MKNSIALRALNVTESYEQILQPLLPLFRQNTEIVWSGPGYSFSTNSQQAIAANAPHLPEMDGVASWARQRPYLMCHTLRIRGSAGGVNYTCDDGLIGHLSIESSLPESRALIEILEGHVRLISAVDIAMPSAVTESERRALVFREQAIADLTQQVKSLGACLERISEAHSQRMTEEIVSIELMRAKAREEIDAQKATARAEIAADKAVLESERKNYETQEPRLQRRKYRDNFYSEVSSESDHRDRGNSPDGQAGRFRRVLNMLAALATRGVLGLGRSPFYITVLLMCGILGYTAYTFGTKFLASSDVKHLGVFSSSMAGLIATLLYLARRIDRWAADDVAAAERITHNKADMTRANWLAELLIEWKEAGVEAPSSIVEIMARSLFTERSPNQTVDHPMSSIIELASKAHRLELGNGRVLVETSKKGE